MSAIAEEYVLLMHAFLDHSLSPAAFQERYLAKFKAETRKLDERTYQVLDKVFGDLDAFTTDELLRYRINKSTRQWSPKISSLRLSVQSAVKALHMD